MEAKVCDDPSECQLNLLKIELDEIEKRVYEEPFYMLYCLHIDLYKLRKIATS